MSSTNIPRPTDASIILTYRCPMRCQMCNIWQNPTKKSEEIKAADLRSLPQLKFINLTGGEPFIREDLEEIVEEKHRRLFHNNYRCTSLPYQKSELTPTNISYIENQLVDKFDDDKLKEINETVFMQCPLMIVNTRTEQVRNTERFRYDAKSIFL